MNPGISKPKIIEGSSKVVKENLGSRRVFRTTEVGERPAQGCRGLLKVMKKYGGSLSNPKAVTQADRQP